MARVFLGIGSNVNKEDNIRSGLNVLERIFGAIHCSPVYESESIGFDGDNFLNLVAEIETDLPLDALVKQLRSIEDDHGRIRSCVKFSSRTLDIDILTYDDLVGHIDGVNLPRDEILTNAFVLKPMADIAADCIHPVAGLSYAELWQRYPKGSQRLWQVDLTC